MVFQSYNLFPHKTALKNVMEGPIIVKKENRDATRKKAQALHDKVGLGEIFKYD
jgi:L-cystine transport system ATP-binding protein